MEFMRIFFYVFCFQISSFSGDPSRVTLFGSGSAGGKSALLHLASPANRGKRLFHRVVAHSGLIN